MSNAERPPLSNSEIVTFLSGTTTDATFVDNLKIRYRPYVCPFDQLLSYADQDVQSVYDVGCGSGQFAALVANFTHVRDIHGIEIDQRLVDNANELAKPFTNKNMSFATFDGTTIPDDISASDLVYMIDVYHHIPKDVRNDVMAQIYDKMKPGAKLMFKDIDGASPFVLCNKVHDLIFARELSHEIGFGKARSLLQNLGFTILEARKKQVLVYPHYFLLAQK